MTKRLKSGKRNAEVLVKPKRKVIRRKKKPNNVVDLYEWLHKEVTNDKEMKRKLETRQVMAVIFGEYRRGETDYLILRSIYLEYKLGIKSSVECEETEQEETQSF